MLSYKVTYRLQMGAFVAETPDFPEASAFGASLSDARSNLVLALTSAAERKLRRGDPLPIPDPHRDHSDAYLVERVTLVPITTDRVEARVESALI
jgi:predicted RNase H-like HicB family nuclease